MNGSSIDCFSALFVGLGTDPRHSSVPKIASIFFNFWDPTFLRRFKKGSVLGNLIGCVGTLWVPQLPWCRRYLGSPCSARCSFVSFLTHVRPQCSTGFGQHTSMVFFDIRWGIGINGPGVRSFKFKIKTRSVQTCRTTLEGRISGLTLFKTFRLLASTSSWSEIVSTLQLSRVHAVVGRVRHNIASSLRPRRRGASSSQHHKHVISSQAHHNFVNTSQNRSHVSTSLRRFKKGSVLGNLYSYGLNSELAGKGVAAVKQVKDRVKGDLGRRNGKIFFAHQFSTTFTHQLHISFADQLQIGLYMHTMFTTSTAVFQTIRVNYSV